MTQVVHIQVKAEELKMGNLFAHWAIMDDGLYPEGVRILDIKKSKKKMKVILADGRKLELFPDMLVVIQDYA